MVASATIHELLLFIFESVKLKKLNFWSIFMQWLKTCLSLFLLFAILLVGSAAAASSVHKRCFMPSEQMKSMQMEASQNQDMMHTDCMKVEAKVKKTLHDPSCMSEQDCIMSFAKIAYTPSPQEFLYAKVFPPIERSAFYSLDQNLPAPFPSVLWKPPRSN